MSRNSSGIIRTRVCQDHPHTTAGLNLWEWAESDALPLTEFGFETVHAAIVAIEQQAGAGSSPTFVEVLKANGWRVELFWNGSGGWFTARLVSLVDRDGRRGYAGGYLVPYGDPLGASGQTPGEAIANLGEMVLEWA